MTTPEPEPRNYGFYVVEKLLGRGGIGTVYLARDRRIGRRVALKTVQLSPRQSEDTTATKDFYSRLQREAELFGQLHHPNIVTLYDVGYDDERVTYLAMEYVEGDTLLARMKKARPGTLPLETSLAIIADVLSALACAHQKGIVHRDIKPANVLLDHEDHAKVADFGIARPQNSSLTGAGALLGTPNYMSPEQVLAQTLTPRADVFSTGVMLYEMLTDVRPFTAQELTVILHNILRQTPPHVSDVNPAVPRTIGDFVARLMEKNPEQRPDAAQALRELEALDKAKGEGRKAKVSRKPFLLAPIVIALVIAGVGIFIGISRTRSRAKPTITIPIAQIQEFDAKRKALDEADALFNEGKFEESLKQYEDYLKKYPDSLAAQQGRDRSREAIEKTKTSRKPTKKPPPPKDKDISPSELLNRLKRVFRR
jgi:serine/threonine protein kinase